MNLANFPRLRRRALDLLLSESRNEIATNTRAVPLTGRGYAAPEEARAIVKANIQSLSDPETKSFLCPDDGRMIDPRTPCLFSLEAWHLPFRQIAIEYSNTIGDRERCLAKDNFFPDATILLVRMDEALGGETILIANSLWFSRGVCIPASVSFLMTARTSIETLPSGEVRMRDFGVCSASGNALDMENQTQWAHDLADEMSVLAHFVLLCNCDNVSPAKVFGPSAALVKRAKERGNNPPDEYYVLDCFLGEHAEKVDPLGGSHASPRFHVRRGHIRRLQDGRKTWVKQCSVGDVSNGRIDKDYRVKIRSQETSA